MKKSFSMAACKEGERAKYVNGAIVIVSEQHASMLEIDGVIFNKTPIPKASEAHVKQFFWTTTPMHTYTFTALESVGRDTFAHSLINPATGEAWKEGEKERHLQNAVVATSPSIGNQDDDGSIASDELEGWEMMQLRNVEIEGLEGVTAMGNYELEGMEEVVPTSRGSVKEDQEDENMEEEEEKLVTSGLGKELRETLVLSGRVGPGEDQSLGWDIQNLMRVARIAALKETPATIASSRSLNKFDKSNMGKDSYY
jgi:hypothetical protein